MLLQTNSYIVPKERRAEHARLMRRFRQILHNLGCDNFEIYEQVGSNWSNTETSGRFVQIMRFRDRKHQLAVQNAERSDPAAQQLIAEFCELVNYPYQQQQGQFAVGFYSSVLPVAPGPSVADPSPEAAGGTPAEVIDESPESAEGEVPAEETAVAQEPFAAESDQAPGEGEPFVNEELEQVEAEPEAEHQAEAPATEGPAYEETTEGTAETPLPPRPIPAPDADLDADLDIPDDDLSRLADELGLDEEPDPGHAHGHGGHGGGRGSENRHS